MVGHTDTKLLYSAVYYRGKPYVCFGPGHHKKAVEKLRTLREEDKKKASKKH